MNRKLSLLLLIAMASSSTGLVACGEDAKPLAPITPGKIKPNGAHTAPLAAPNTVL